MSPSRRETSLVLSELLKQDLFLFSDRVRDLRYKEHHFNYIWGKTMMRMILEMQCLGVGMIVFVQAWILALYGPEIFGELVGDDILLPLLYMLAVIMGSLTYAKPAYWRIAMSLTLYTVTIYFSLMVSNVAAKILIAPGLAEQLQHGPENAGVWVPWAIGFALHMQMCMSSGIIALISIRDMYTFDPKKVSENMECPIHPNSVAILPTPADDMDQPTAEKDKTIGNPIVYI